MQGLTKIKPLDWEDVFAIWRDNEAHLTDWIEHFTSKGFGSWEEWRKPYADQFGLPRKKWSLYRIVDPEEVVASFYGGPFPSWIEKFYEGKTTSKFSDLVERTDIQNHERVLSIYRHFPNRTTITGVETDQGVVIVEGMHRACALALAKRTGEGISDEVYVALADYEPGSLPNFKAVQSKENIAT